MKKEIWKDIKGYEGSYQVSNLGNVKSIKFKKMLMLKQYKDKDGYLRIILHKNGKPKNYCIHRLVANAFIPNPKNYPEINHKDECKTNNMWCNLEWCTSKYNCNYGTRNERKANTCKKKVLQYDLNNNFIKEWDGIIDIEKSLGISHQSISHCCNKTKNYKTAGGFIWVFK